MAPQSLLLPLFFLFILFHTSFAEDPIDHVCLSTTYPPGSPYKTNINDLLRLLITKGSPTGFGTSLAGQGINTVYGMALCRADASSATCKTCIADVGKTIQKRCPRYQAAIIWYDTCYLKYKNTNFFGKVDDGNQFVMCNQEDIDIDSDEFQESTNDLMLSLADKARLNSKRFATGKVDLGDENMLYGLAECSRDLIAADCKTCLENGISQIPGWCYGKRGGRVMGGNCIARYELYPF